MTLMKSVAVEVVEDSFEGLEIEEVDDSYEKCCSGGNGGEYHQIWNQVPKDYKP